LPRFYNRFTYPTHTETINYMSTEGVDKSRRRFLATATTVVGGVGAAFTAYPFISYWQPSAKAQAAGAPVEVDISKLEPGERMTVEWRGKPVWILRRTGENVSDLDSIQDKLRDPKSDIVDQQPKYAQNPTRSLKPEFLIVVGVCTHLGCSPMYVKKEEAASHNLSSDWKGGFFCPCHGSRFDLAGRVFQGVPAPLNLVIPPHKYLDDNRVVIGIDSDDKGVG
jgi:ubiquinol-cytochrome c reductase iron-sulfur subunit